MKSLTTTLLLIFCVSSFSLDEKTKRIWNLLLKEEKTIKSLGRLDTGLRYRLLEIESEKLAIIREDENARVLKTGKRSKDYYAKTKLRAAKIEKEAKYLINKNPYFVGIPNIYYTIGMNARDLGDEKKSAFYLEKALSLSKEKGDLLYKIHVALAEHYYNGKKYKKAIFHYTYVINNMADEWTSKNFYNYAWCLLLEKRFDEAINALVKSYELSNDKRFVDVTGQILDSAASFFVKGKRVSEGAEFYAKAAPKEPDYFTKLARRANTHLGVEDALFTYNFAIKHFLDQKLDKEQIIVEVDLFNFYLEAKIFDKFEGLGHDLVTKREKLSEDQKKNIIDLLTQRVGFLQATVSKDGIEKYSEGNLTSIVNIFDELALINPTLNYKYEFLEGETFFGLAMFDKALKNYLTSLEFSKKEMGIDDFKKKLYNSILATISEGQFTKEAKENNLIFVYSSYIVDFPKNEEAPIIYKDLFRIFIDRNETAKAFNTLATYNKNINKDLGIQKELYKNLLENLFKRNQINDLTLHVNKINAGQFSLEMEYRNKVTMALGELLFKQYDTNQKNGLFKDAEEGYAKIYKDEKLPRVLRGISAHNLAIMKIKLNDTNSTWAWNTNSMPLLTMKEIKERENNYISLVKAFYDREEYIKAQKLGLWYMRKFCKVGKGLDDVYFQTTTALYFNEKTHLTSKLVDMGEKCGVSAKMRSESIVFIARNLYLFNKDAFLTFYQKNKLNHLVELAPFINDFVTFAIDNYDNELLSKVLPLTNSIQREKITAFQKKLNEFEQKKQNVHIYTIQAWNNREFKEDIFNNWLETSLASLDKFFNENTAYMKTLSPSMALEFNINFQKKFTNENEKLTALNFPNLKEEERKMVVNEIAKIQKKLGQKSQKISFNIEKTLNERKPLDFHNFANSKLQNEIEFSKFPIYSHHLAGAIDMPWEELAKGEK